MSIAPSVDMTLRDYFAAHALSGLLVRADWTDDENIKNLGLHSYRLADAMLKARDVQSVQSEYETCGQCMGSGYSNHPDSGEICQKCGGNGNEAATASKP